MNISMSFIKKSPKSIIMIQMSWISSYETRALRIQLLVCETFHQLGLTLLTRVT